MERGPLRPGPPGGPTFPATAGRKRSARALPEPRHSDERGGSGSSFGHWHVSLWLLPNDEVEERLERLVGQIHEPAVLDLRPQTPHRDFGEYGASEVAHRGHLALVEGLVGAGAPFERHLGDLGVA